MFAKDPGPDKAHQPRKLSAKNIALAASVGEAYRELNIPVAALIGAIPRDAFLPESLQSRVIPMRLKDPENWVEVPREGDDTRGYLHRYIVAVHRDWSYRLRWHTPTPSAIWAGRFPEMMIERRWRHYVDNPVERRHELLIRGYGELSEEARAVHKDLKIDVAAGGYAWIAMASWSTLRNFSPRTPWVRVLRDLAHFPGHPEGFEVPGIAKEGR